MHFLIDENIPVKIITWLQEKGYKVTRVKPSSTDEIIAREAKEKEIVLLTQDKHFADILSYPPSQYFGIVRIRIHPSLISKIKTALENFLKDFSAKKVKGCLIILTEKGIRVRKS